METRFFPEQIPEKWLEALERGVLSEFLAGVGTAYRKLEVGDVITFSYLLDRGVTMSVNGRTIARTSGQTMIDVILEEWAERQGVSGNIERFIHAC